MERKNGYCIIDDFKRINDFGLNSRLGDFCDGWDTDGNKEYLFKLETDTIAYSELFYSYLLRKIGLDTVENDLAKLDGREDAISLNYNPKYFLAYRTQDILEKYTSSGYAQRNSYNLEKLIALIEWFCESSNF